MKNTKWKVSVIVAVGVVAVILMIVFGVQSTKNHAIVPKEQVNTAKSEIKVQEYKHPDCNATEGALQDLFSDEGKFYPRSFLSFHPEIRKLIDNIKQAIDDFSRAKRN